MAETMQHRKRRIRSVLKTGLAVLLFLAALLLVSYPYISNYVYERQAASLVLTTQSTVDSLDDAVVSQMRQEAAAYNESLLSSHVQLTDPFNTTVQGDSGSDYEDLLDVGNGIMGILEIPSINVSLPIYHGTSEAVLEKGVGHLEGTSLPIGGTGSHTVLTGHTGLSSAKLFSDLSLLEEGDVFYLYVLGETLTYQVDQIKVVLPTELDDLAIQSDADYCTLLTCTPYGVNTHRLLVRGVRVETPTEEATESISTTHGSSPWMAEYRAALLISLSLFGVGLIILIAIRIRRNRRKRKKQAETSTVESQAPE